MKKKLIQILMLLVAAVSVGSFVSCKDTNEDLYNELRAKSIADDATLREALETRIGELEDLINAINSCECDTAKMLGWVNSEDKYLQEQIDAINGALAALSAADNVYTKPEVDALIHGLQDQINIITATFATNENLAKLVDRVSAIEYLKDEVKTLREKLDAIKSCECDCATVMSKLGALEADMATIKAQVEQALKDIKAIEDLAKAAKTAADNAQTAADNAKALAETAKSTADEAKTLSEILKGLYETAAQNATEAKTAAAEAKTMAENNKSAIESLDKKVQELDGKVNLATTTAQNALDKATDAAAKADANKKLIDKLTERVAKNEENIKNLQEKVANMEKLAEQVGANTEAISTLKEQIKEVAELKEKVAALEQAVKDCRDICKANLDAAKAEIRTEIADLKTELVDRIATNEETLRVHEKAIEQLKDMIKDFASKEDIEKINEKLDELEKADIKLDERLVGAETKLKDLEPRVKALENTVNNDILPRLKKAEETLAEITPKVEQLVTDVAAIQDYLRSQVTGLIIQGTYNPMFGTFSIPANIQSNVLVAYYGKAAKKVEFPTHYSSETGSQNYVRTNEILTDKDWEMISDGLTVFTKPLGATIMNEDKDGNANAGKVYVTVNPTSFDATGLQLNIVNTQDVESPITLSPLKKSDETLQFGFARADNGFYEADASIKRADLSKIEIAISESSLQGIIDEARTKIAEMGENFFKTTGASGDLGGLATKVYNIIHEMRVDQQGLKCPSKDIDGNDQAIYSQYNMAATVFRPLNLASFKDLHYATIPGYEDAQDFIDRIAETLNGHVKVMFADANGSWKVNKLFNNLTVDGISLADYTDNMIAHFKARVSHFTLNGISYELTIPGTGSLDIKFDKNLKASGSAVTLPAGKVYDENKPSLTKATLVIGGDIVDGMTAALIIPAIGGDGVVSAYAYIELIEASVKATLVGSDIQIWSKEDGTFNVATYTGSAVNLTTPNLVLKNLVGSEGYVDVPVAREIAGDAQKIVDQLKTLVDEMNHTLAEINKYEDIIAGENGWINKFLDQYLRKYLDKINHTTVYFVNSINRRFGPFLVASNNYQGFKRLSNNLYIPTELDKNGLNLYPTTKNMELIVPIARKHVAVTDVFDEAGKSAQKDNDYNLVQALKDANSCEELNTVLDGTNRMIPLDASKFKSGYTYQIAYSILDFEGHISTSKYYVKIK